MIFNLIKNGEIISENSTLWKKSFFMFKKGELLPFAENSIWFFRSILFKAMETTSNKNSLMFGQTYDIFGVNSVVAQRSIDLFWSSL